MSKKPKTETSETPDVRDDMPAPYSRFAIAELVIPAPGSEAEVQVKRIALERGKKS